MSTKSLMPSPTWDNTAHDPMVSRTMQMMPLAMSLAVALLLTAFPNNEAVAYIGKPSMSALLMSLI